MKLVLARDKFLSNLFPSADIFNDESLLKAIQDVYGSLRANVQLDMDKVVIDIAVSKGKNSQEGFFKATELCRRGKFAEAIPVFESLRDAMKTDTEYYRNYAQAFEETGQYEQAINLLIEALRFDPKNKWALLLMGNIYVRHYNDLETAYTYFEKVMEADPKNHIVLANIGGVFLKASKNKLAERFFTKALDSNPNFPNALHGMGLLHYQRDEFLTAFDYGQKALRLAENTEQEKVFIGFMTNVASDYIRKGMGEDALKKYQAEVGKLTAKPIKYEVNNALTTEAKIEIAENHKRDYHLVLYKDNVAFIQHLIAHELTHLKYIEEARKENVNKLFSSSYLEKASFDKMMEPTRKKLIQQGLIVEKIDGFIDMVFHGTNSRIYNAPIDLFIEDYIFNHIPELRPQQFLSLSALGKLAHQSVSDPSILAMTPEPLISKIKVYNALSARHFDDLYGTKTEREYSLDRHEKVLIDQLWEEFNEYRRDREPGEEYELIENWGMDLNLSQFFILRDEVLEQKTYTIEDKIKELIGTVEPKTINQEVVQMMVHVLKVFNSLNMEQIEEVAFETALKAKGGISPSETDYLLKSIPGKSFSGQEILVYYYIAWAFYKPEFVGELGLDYGKEFELARALSLE